MSWQKFYQKIWQVVYFTFLSLTYQEAFSACLNVVRISCTIMIGWVRFYQIVFDIMNHYWNVIYQTVTRIANITSIASVLMFLSLCVSVCHCMCICDKVCFYHFVYHFVCQNVWMCVLYVSVRVGVNVRLFVFQCVKMCVSLYHYEHYCVWSFPY